jgi:tetratricopeptide (TPR) repeat protein
MRKHKNMIVEVVILLSLITFSYTSSINGEFQFDDTHSIEENSMIKDVRKLNFDLINWLGGRPVTNLTFAMNYSVSRLDTFGYHVVNLVIHLTVVLLLYLFTKMTLRLANYEDPRNLALITAGIFGLHPLHSQAVSYIVQRAESLASLFYVLSLTLLVKSFDAGFNRKGVALYILGFGAFVLGLGAKEIVVTLPLTYALYSYYFLAATCSPSSTAQGSETSGVFLKRLAVFLPFFVLGGIYTILRLKGFGGRQDIGFDIQGITPMGYFLTQFEVVVTYLRLIVLPINQNLDYDYPLSQGFFQLRTLLSFVVITGIFLQALYLLLTCRNSKKQTQNESPKLVISFALLWFFLILSPTSTVVPVVDVIFEHRVYLASWGIITTLVVTANIIYNRLEIATQKKRQVIAKIVAIAILAALAVMLYERTKVWQSRKSLWSDVVAKSPGKARPHMNLGHALAMEGNYEAAVLEYKTALTLANDKSVSRIEILRNLGVALFQLGMLGDAIEVFTEASTSDPLNADILNNLAICFLEIGNYKKAVYYVSIAVKAQPRHGGAHNTLGEIYFKKKEYNKALESFLQAIQLNPDVPLRYFNAALAFEKLGRITEACKYQARYLEIETNDAERELVHKRMRELGCRQVDP